MTSKFYTETIKNDYLGVTEEIKGDSLLEVKIRAADRLVKWAETERLQRERDLIENTKSLTEFENRQTRKEIESYRNILKYSLKASHRLNWVELYDDTPFKPFVFPEAPPKYEKVASELGVPKKKGLCELLLPAKKAARLNLEKKAKQVFQEKLQEYEDKKAAAQRAHEAARTRYREKQDELNDSIDRLKFDFETGKPHGIERYVSIVLAKSVYPGAIKKEFEVYYDQTDQTVIVNYLLPDIDDLPRARRYEYAPDRDKIIPVEMEPEEFESFYRSVVVQIALRTIHEIFHSVYTKRVRNVAFNGWLLSAGNGERKKFAWCFLTCRVSRELFEKIALDREPPEEIFHKIKGVMAKSFSMPEAVHPLTNFIREGSRFTTGAN